MFQYLLDVLFPSSGAAMLSPSELSYALQAEPCNAHIDEGIGDCPQRIVSAAAYDRSALVQYALCALKYKRQSSYSESVAALLLRSITSDIHADITLCPVPLHWTRYMERGFNQSELIARFLSKKTALPMHVLLRRVRRTGHQAWRTREERLHAMHDAFVVRKNITMPKHVILIDDIVTTGATLHACASALQNAGVARIDAWVIARG